MKQLALPPRRLYHRKQCVLFSNTVVFNLNFMRACWPADFGFEFGFGLLCMRRMWFNPFALQPKPLNI